MPKKTNKDTLKKNLIVAMEDSLGVIKTACESCKCSRQTYYDFIKDDKDFKKAIEESKRTSHDFVRSKLIDNIKNGKEASIFFYMKTQMNWIEKTKMDLTSNDEPINIPPISWVNAKELLKQ